MNAIHHPQQSTGFTTAKLLINGEFVESKTSHWQDIINPATQEVLGQVPFATAEEVNAAIAAAQNAFASWRQTPIQARMRIMLKLWHVGSIPIPCGNHSVFVRELRRLTFRR